jgi:hypothetical protein
MMKNYFLFLLPLLLISCADGEYNLADKSPLPHYFVIPDSTSRRDFTVTYKRYNEMAELTLMDANTNQKLAQLSGSVEEHPLSGSYQDESYPIFAVIRVNADSLFLEHKEMDGLFYVVNQEYIEGHFVSIMNNESSKSEGK